MIVALVVDVLGFSARALAQRADPELQKVIEQYEQAFNKGDAKAIAALYTPDALLLTMRN
jgi:ketosteroid isomerase-like protein